MGNMERSDCLHTMGSPGNGDAKGKNVSFNLPPGYKEGPDGKHYKVDSHGNKVNPPSKGHTLCCFYWFLVVCIFGMISFTIWLSVQLAKRHNALAAGEGTEEPQKEPFTFDDMFNSSMSPSGFSMSWVPNQELFTYREDGNLMKYDAETNEATLLVAKAIFDEVNSGTYWLSHDLRYILFAYEVKSVWRHSFMAKYKIYDVVRDNFINFPNHHTLEGESLMLARWSPSSHKLTFVHNNNMYYQASPSSVAMQVSFEGSVENHIFVGHADWAYEEEVFGTHNAQWWSPDSRYNAYGVFDASNIPLFKFPYYGPKTDVYGSMIEIAYPKAGDLEPGRTSRIRFHVYDTTNDQHKQINPPAALANEDHYVTQVTWKDDRHVVVVWANRIQSRAITTICDMLATLDNATCIINLDETDVWHDPRKTFVFMKNTEKYATIMPKSEGSAGNFRHVHTVLSPFMLEWVPQPAQPLTNGEEVVKSIVRVDQDKHLIYYISTGGDPKDRHLYVVGTQDAAEDDRVSKCITCGMDSDCDYYSVSFSTSAKYYRLTCSGPGVPWYKLMKTEDHSVVKVLEDNAQYKLNIANKALPTVKWMKVPVGGGFEAEAQVFIPPGAEDDIRKTHPLLVHVYGGPGSQAVNKAYPLTGWQAYLTSSEEAVYARIDGRGTASRGDRNRFAMHRSLGTVEIEDQIAGAEWMRNNLGYVSNTKHTAIWGWSYGGFATLHSMSNESQTFMCGISGAALMDRRLYDTIYTERTMGLATPEDNQYGYNRTDVTRKIEHMKDKKLLLVHGTADDNVHFASSVHMIKALTDAEIQYRLQIYTDQNHYFLSRSRHAYTLFTDFLVNDCWSETTQSDDEVDTIKIYVKRKDAPKQKKKFVRKEICV